MTEISLQNLHDDDNDDCCRKLIWVLVMGIAAKTSVSLATSPALPGILRRSLASQEISSLQCVLGLPWNLYPFGHAQNTFPGGRLGGILTRCLNHLRWLLLMWRCHRPIQSLSWVTDIPTPSLRESPATLIPAAAIRNSVLWASNIHTHRYKCLLLEIRKKSETPLAAKNK